jgi:hypothetical protein
MTILLIAPNRVKASSSNWIFNGTITPTCEYMIGDTPRIEDFKIDGTLSNGDVTYKTDEIKGTIRSTDLKEVNSNYKLEVYVYSKDVYPYGCYVNVEVKVNEFNPKLSYSLDGKEIKIDKISKKSEDGFDTILYIEEFDNFTTNIYGGKVNGNIKFNNIALHFGYNELEYRFTPYDNRYGVLYGNFTVFYTKKPTLTVYKDRININMNNRSNLYDFIFDGKSYDTCVFKNLKPGTKHTIKIYQKESEKHKRTLLYETSVTTKKK